MGEETCRKLGENARKAGIVLSLHAPYFINLANPDPDSLQKTIGYITAACEAADWMGSTRVIIHSGALMKRTRREALDIAIPSLKAVLAACDGAGYGHIALCPETMGKINQLGDLDEVLELCQLDERLLPAVAAGGADFVFLGGPGSELIPPAYYEEFLIPYSQTLSAMAHAQGLLIYSHICSPIEPMLSLGYYNQMGIDLFETLSEPPVGNVKSLEDAFSKLDGAICTRGNLGLDLLLTASPAEILDRSVRILETAQRMGRKHILAASDYLFYDTPAENVHAMCEAVRRFHSL